MFRALLAPLLLGALGLFSLARASDVDRERPALRRPVALALAENGRWLYVANRRSGTISVVDTTLQQPVAERSVGRTLADLALTADGRNLLAVDEAANEVILLACNGSSLTEVSRIGVSAAPVCVCVPAGGTRTFVTSLWSRRVTVCDLKPSGIGVFRTIPLPFAPRQMLSLRDGAKLLVADAFAGRLAVVDVGRPQLESVRTIPGHNFRGLTLSGDAKEVFCTHQILSGLAHTTQDDVHWGNLITNNLRVLSLDAILDQRADLLHGSRLHYLGEVGNGAGDPAGLAVAKDGKIVVALSGVSEITIGPGRAYDWRRLSVGNRPCALVLSPDGGRAYVANHFSDSISIVNLNGPPTILEISLGKQPALTSADRGEMLFYDARLAHDGWMSCHSCHTDGHTTGMLNDNLGDGSFGAPKRILSLLGVRDTAPYTWLGLMPDLESQVRKSILTTMHGKEPLRAATADLASFLQTLPPPPSRSQTMAVSDLTGIEHGSQVFQKQSCNRCHRPPTYTSRKTYDVGLEDAVGNKRFNPPSLRGVSQGGPYFHDNRAATLEEVLDRFKHQLSTELSQAERKDLLIFLRSL